MLKQACEGQEMAPQQRKLNHHHCATLINTHNTAQLITHTLSSAMVILIKSNWEI